MLATQGTMLAAAVGSPEAERMAGGLRVGPYLLRLVYPAKDGDVTITYLFGDMIGPYTQRLMSWVHEEGFCSAELRDLDYVSFFELLFTGQLDLSLLTQAADAVAALTATKTKAELFAEARRRRLLIAPVETTKELASFEQFAGRGFWDEVAVDASGVGSGRGAVRFPGPWAHPTRTPLRHLGPPPRLGEHNRLAPDLLNRRPSAPSAVEPPPTGRALEDLKVLDFTWVVAGPLTTQAARRSRRHRRAHREREAPRRRPRRRPLPGRAHRRRGQCRLAQLRSRQALTPARRLPPRGHARRARSRPLGGRRDRVVHAGGHPRLGVRLRRAARHQSSGRHVLDVADGPDRTARPVLGLRQPGCRLNSISSSA